MKEEAREEIGSKTEVRGREEEGEEKRRGNIHSCYRKVSDPF